MATLLDDILTEEWLLNTYLKGVNLTDANGVALPSSLYLEAISTAIRHVEGLLDLRILPTIIKKERQDLHRIDRGTFWMHGTYNRPLMVIDELRLKLGNLQMMKLPQSWLYELAPNFGTFTVIPTMEQIVAGTYAAQALLWYRGDNLPGALEIDYRAGMLVTEGTVTFAAGDVLEMAAIGQELLSTDYDLTFSLVNPALPDVAIRPSVGAKGNSEFEVRLSSAPSAPLTVRWVLSTLPADLKALIGLNASLLPLAVAGTTLVGPGIASKSVSIDGLSQSIGTTASATKHAYSNRADAHQEMFERMLPYVRGRYTGPGMSIS